METTINERIIQLRTALKLNQTELGANIGLKQGAVSKMEQPGGTVSDRNIKQFCDTFGVSETWLRTGDGEMFATPEGKDVFDVLREQYHMTPVEERILRAYFDADDDERKAISAFIDKTAEDIAARKAQKNAPEIPEAKMAIYKEVKEQLEREKPIDDFSYLSEEEKQMIKNARMKKDYAEDVSGNEIG